MTRQKLEQSSGKVTRLTAATDCNHLIILIMMMTKIMTMAMMMTTIANTMRMKITITLNVCMYEYVQFGSYTLLKCWNGYFLISPCALHCYTTVNVSLGVPLVTLIIHTYLWGWLVSSSCARSDHVNCETCHMNVKKLVFKGRPTSLFSSWFSQTWAKSHEWQRNIEN